jgi:hypothetical protein
MVSVTAIIMIGPGGRGEIERMVSAARMAAAVDLMAALTALPHTDRIIVAHHPDFSPHPEFATHPKLAWEPDPSDLQFHFGRRLYGIIGRYHPEHVLYLGAGSMPLMLSKPPLSSLCETFEFAGVKPVAYTNNIHSADWAAFNRPSGVGKIVEWLDRDNMLAWRLRENLGYQVSSCQPSAETRLDIDTPFDLQVLTLHPRTPPRLKTLLQTLQPVINLRTVTRAAEVLRAPGSRVTLIGRVPADVCQELGARQLWTRVFSEERGMSANRRQAEGKVFSFVADYIDRVGEAAFVDQLAQTSDLVLFDTRVLLAHHRLWPSTEERFASDLGRFEKIGDARLRRLTEACLSATIPILLGGHNVVSGGLYALLDLVARDDEQRADYQP